MGDLIKPGTHRSTNIKVKIKILKKKQKCTLFIALKILYMRFLTAQLNKTLIKKIRDMKDTQNVQNIRKFDFSNLIFVLSGSSLHCNVRKTC